MTEWAGVMAAGDRQGGGGRACTPWLLASQVSDCPNVALSALLHASSHAQITVFKYKPKKHYRRTNGHRQQLTRFMVTEVLEGQEAGEAPVAVVDENPAAATEEAA